MKLKLEIKPILNYAFVTVLTAALISIILIALPLTEKVSPNANFNLITKDATYWSKEYILTLDTTEKKDIEKTRDILFKRLTSFGVEEVSIRTEGIYETNSKLKVTVNTTKGEEFVSELVKNQFDVQIMTRKPEVDFMSEENQYAYIMASNYNPTDWDSSDFRNIYITELRTNNNDYAYFAIFKMWPNKENQFNKFLKEYQGEYLGVRMDNFVTPYLVPTDTASGEIFAIPVNTTDETQIKVMSLLYNSGSIPVTYTTESEAELQPQIISIDYVKVTIGIAISLLTVYLYLILFKHTELNYLFKSFLATVLTISTYLAILKLFQIPIDTFLLAIEAILVMTMIRVMSENEDSVIHLELAFMFVFLILMLLSFGYLSILAKDLILLVILAKMSLLFSNWYISKVKDL